MENETNMDEEILELDKLYVEGEYAECKRRLLGMLEQEPGFGRAHHMLGCLYFYVLDDQEKAAKHLRLAVKFAPRYPIAYLTYARVLNYLNRHGDLLELVSAALNVEGINGCAMLIELGKSYELNGDLKTALNKYRAAERYAISPEEVGAVKAGIRRVRQKIMGPLRRLLFLK